MPITYIFKPSGLKNISTGIVSCAATENSRTNEAVDIFQGVVNVYWLTSSPVEPVMYMVVPSGVKNIPSGVISSAATENSLTKKAVDIFHGVDNVYWLTSSPEAPVTYMFRPSGLKNNPAGDAS